MISSPDSFERNSKKGENLLFVHWNLLFLRNASGTVSNLICMLSKERKRKSDTFIQWSLSITWSRHVSPILFNLFITWDKRDCSVKSTNLIYNKNRIQSKNDFILCKRKQNPSIKCELTVEEWLQHDYRGAILIFLIHGLFFTVLSHN